VARACDRCSGRTKYGPHACLGPFNLFRVALMDHEGNGQCLNGTYMSVLVERTIALVCVHSRAAFTNTTSIILK
jgi:hypothetical protein